MTAPASPADNEQNALATSPPDNEQTRPTVGAGSSGGLVRANTGDTTTAQGQERPPHIDAAVDVLTDLLADTERVWMLARTVADEFGDLAVDDRRHLGDKYPRLVAALLAVEHFCQTRLEVAA